MRKFIASAQNDFSKSRVNRGITRFRSAVYGVMTCMGLLLAPYAPAAAEKITYYHFDATGSPVAATDEQGKVIWRERYEPYGDRIDKPPAAQTNTRWHTGHVQDPDTGLVYAGARYYDPTLGRFLSIDPKGPNPDSLHSINRYAYGNNNPYKYVDPDGQFPILAVCATPPGATACATVGEKIIEGLLWAGVIVGGKVLSDADYAPGTIPEPIASLPMPPLIYAKPPENARDPNGPKAPGKPGEAEGFRDPKGGEDWVPNPNGPGNGWRDANGDVWVPTGQGGRAHGGPHWDVQTPGGGYRNVRPKR